jgi:hypothetical protein
MSYACRLLAIYVIKSRSEYAAEDMLLPLYRTVGSRVFLLPNKERHLMPPALIFIPLLVFAVVIGLEFAWGPAILLPHPGLDYTFAERLAHMSASARASHNDGLDPMSICVSIIVLIAGLWVILSKRYVATDRHWAYGAVGTIIGYWLG